MGVEVDPAFVQEIEHRPKPTVVEADGIPQIDLSPLLNTPIPDAATAGEIPPALSNLVAEVEIACREWGFFQVINHGVPLELLDRIQSAAREFFALPADEKRRVKRDEKTPLGYYDTEHTKNVRDWKEVFDFFVPEPAANKELPLNFKNQWPEYPPHLQEISEEYANEVEKLAFRILELIALTLGLPAKRLDRYFEEEQTSYIRLNHYPPCPFPDLALGVGRHKDAVVLTVLSQDEVGGLEVKRRSDGEWVRVKPVPNSYIINVGDIIQVWSNDRYESVGAQGGGELGEGEVLHTLLLHPGVSDSGGAAGGGGERGGAGEVRGVHVGRVLHEAQGEQLQEAGRRKHPDLSFPQSSGVRE